jgi:hypothetical protein
MKVYGGGCLICDGPHSCYNVEFVENADESGKTEAYKNVYFEGSIGPSCPQYTSAKPSLSCFSGGNTVETRGKGITTIDSLEIGDYVKTGVTRDGTTQYSPVISFMHVDPRVEVEYRQIFTNISPTLPLEISDDHLLYLHDDKVIRAKNVQVGDILKGDTTYMIVTHIQNIHRQGLYAPLTENGKIWVSGVTASSYVALVDENILSTNMQAVLSHMALLPLRLVCSVGRFSTCKNETYSEDGYSMNLFGLIQFGHQFMTWTKFMQLLTLIAVAPLIIVLCSAETALNRGIWVVLLSVGLFVITTAKVKPVATVKAAK